MCSRTEWHRSGIHLPVHKCPNFRQPYLNPLHMLTPQPLSSSECGLQCLMSTYDAAVPCKHEKTLSGVSGRQCRMNSAHASYSTQPGPTPLKQCFTMQHAEAANGTGSRRGSGRAPHQTTSPRAPQNHASGCVRHGSMSRQRWWPRARAAGARSR